MSTPSLLVVEGSVPLHEAAACRAALNCVNATGNLLATARAAVGGAVVTEEAIFYCLHALDAAFCSAHNYHGLLDKDNPISQSIRLADRMRKMVHKSVAALKASAHAPTEGWRSLWDIYRERFGSQLGPTWADVEYQIEQVDCGQMGLLRAARIFVLPEAVEHSWHAQAWPVLCQHLCTTEWPDSVSLGRELRVRSRNANAEQLEEAVEPGATLRLLSHPQEVETKQSALTSLAATSSTPKVHAHSQQNCPRVVLRGRDEGPLVLGKEKPRLTDREYNILKALLDAEERGLSKDKLDEKSGHSESRKVLAALRDSDPDWGTVIHMPGKAGQGGYRIR